MKLESTPTGAAPETLRAHLAVCAECRAYAEDLARISEAFRAAAAEALPEPSFGFAERLVRRLATAAGKEVRAPEFVERAGKRVAFATMVLAMLTLLALGLPSTGPMREPSGAEMMAQAYQISSSNGVVFADDNWVSQTGRPVVQPEQAAPSQK